MESAHSGIIRSFSEGSFRTEDLIRLLAPSAVELKGQAVPPDQVFYFATETTVTLRTRDPKIGVCSWLKPAPDEEVVELQVRPVFASEPFEGFATRCSLGEEAGRVQSTPLSDVQHIYRFKNREGRDVEVVVNEIVFSGGDAVGRIGEITVRKSARSTDRMIPQASSKTIECLDASELRCPRCGADDVDNSERTSPQSGNSGDWVTFACRTCGHREESMDGDTRATACVWFHGETEARAKAPKTEPKVSQEPKTAAPAKLKRAWTFESSLSLEEMKKALDENSSSPWETGDSAQFGGTLGHFVPPDSRARIHSVEKGYVVQLESHRVDYPGLFESAAMRLQTEILPWVHAANVRVCDLLEDPPPSPQPVESKVITGWWSFKSGLSMESMKKALDSRSPSPWAEGNSAWFGDYLGQRLTSGKVVRIYRAPKGEDGYIINFDEFRDPADRKALEEVLAWVGARDMTVCDSLD